jgi:23S rRNA (guanosine2251-2'-O)-methyltransferase
MPVLYGVHPVAEALRAGRPLDRILIAKGAGGTRIQEIIDLARRASVPLRFEPRDALDRLATSAAHQGVVALGAANRYADLDATVANAKLLVVLDGVEDPHNLGAIARTAHAAGANAIVIPERRAAGLTDTVAKAAAGALEHLPVVRVTNINRTLESLKEQGYWIYGLDERGTELYNQVKWGTPTALVFGAEGHGLHEQVRKKCDVLVRIPMAGQIASLNVSVAAGIVLFKWRESLGGVSGPQESQAPDLALPGEIPAAGQKV